MWESETESSRRQNTPSGLFFASVELLSDGWHSATHRPRLTESLLNGFNKLFQRQIITEAPEEREFLLCFHWQRGIQEVRLLPITIEFILVSVHCSRLQRPLPPTQKKKNPILVNRYQVKLTAIVTSQLYTLIRKDNGFSWVCRPTVAACVFKQRGRGAGAFGGGQLLQRLISRTTSCLFRGCFFFMSLLQTNHNNNKNTSGTWGTTSTEFPVGGESAALSVLAVGQPEGHRLCFLGLSRV